MNRIKKSKTILAEYADNTTLHGFKYLSDRRRLFSERVYWIVIFAISFLCLGVFIQNVFKKYNDKSLIVVEDERPTAIHEIPFPAVTVCPVVKIKTKFFSNQDVLNWISETESNNMITDLAYVICNERVVEDLKNVGRKSFKQYFNTSHIKLLHDISPKISESIDNIYFASKRIGTKFSTVDNNPFSYILTNEGVCFTFNLPSEIIGNEPSLQTDYKYHNIQNESNNWEYGYGYYGYPRYPRSVWGIGPINGLYFSLYSSISDLNTVCQPTQIGYKIILHSPAEYPTTFEKFISIPYNTYSKIRVIPKIMKTSGDVRKLRPEDRQCFFDYERRLKYFKYYNRVNCKLECLANYTQQQYGCVHFSLPRNSSTPICGSNITRQLYDMEEIMHSYYDFKQTVEQTFYYRTKLTEDDPFDFKVYSNLNCNCLPVCISEEYEYSIETETIDLKKTMEKYHGPSSSDPLYAFANVDIFYGVVNITGSTRKQFYSLADLIANIGGLIGLFMGASILSVFEIIYFIFVR